MFFIDRVSNHADDDGIIHRLFDEAFVELRAGHDDWGEVEPADVRAAFFAGQRHRGGVRELVDSVTGEAERDQAAYELIMKDKEAAIENPHEWASVAVRVLKDKLADHVVNGIQYEKTGGWYEMRQILDEEEVELFAKHIVEAGGEEGIEVSHEGPDIPKQRSPASALYHKGARL